MWATEGITLADVPLNCGTPLSALTNLIRGHGYFHTPTEALRYRSYTLRGQLTSYPLLVSSCFSSLSIIVCCPTGRA